MFKLPTKQYNPSEDFFLSPCAIALREKSDEYFKYHTAACRYKHTRRKFTDNSIFATMLFPPAIIMTIPAIILCEVFTRIPEIPAQIRWNFFYQEKWQNVSDLQEVIRYSHESWLFRDLSIFDRPLNNLKKYVNENKIESHVVRECFLRVYDVMDTSRFERNACTVVNETIDEINKTRHVAN